MVADVGNSHIPNVTEHDDLVGLTLFCVVLELSNVLHSGTYDEENPITDKERIILIEARKYARLITQWIRASYEVTDGEDEVDIFQMLLWQVAMTLAKTVYKNDKLGSVLSGCTPDNVAAALYDTLFKGPYSAQAWKKRGEHASSSYDWEGPTLSIQARSSHLFFPDEEDGKTESDLCYIDKLEPPSFIKGIAMEKWLQM